eukprot:2878642-Heterocapsa_arctica.AAC.1
MFHDIRKSRWVRAYRKRLGWRMRAGLQFAFFAFSVHLFACMWYLCAALHDDPEASWVARRGILEERPAYQYSASYYVVVT